MQLRKSGTFSSPTNISSDLFGLDNRHYMPRRSPTSIENLEDLVHDAGVRRVANLLKDFDNKLSGQASSSDTNPSILNDPEVLPLPSFLLDNTHLDTTPMDMDAKPTLVDENAHDHASDSGLGSSLSGSKYGDNSTRTRGSISSSVSSGHCAITRSFSALGVSEESHTLGEYASKQIHDHIIKPILAEEALKDFHPLIKDVPRRIGEKNISNLRDLEKTLIFLAPEFSTTPTSYLRFCERSIQLLHATVDCLSEQDQCLPSDRPYTNNYFLDLVEQIRRYAAIMAATRQKEANGEELDEMDYSPDEKMTLRGGLSKNGRPAELVREKNGKVIPLKEGSSFFDDAGNPSSAKRALSDDETDDDGVKRSMARRRKSEKPGDVMHVCRDCKKEFKRPCDLTKHEKTHSRPWKCTEEKCKYYELGWPTEKERDRHVNDKHSAAPPQYKCLYPPCTYASKRESNCKQHMEKAHGWEYVRSKSNGRKKATTSSSTHPSPATPLTPSFLGTPRSSLATPMTPFIPSPSMPLIDFDYGFNFANSGMNFQSVQQQEDYRRDSVTTDGSILTYSSGHSPIEPTSFEDAVTPEDAVINHNDIFNGCFNPSYNDTTFQQQQQQQQQQPTPALSTGFDTYDTMDFPRFSVPAAAAPGSSHIPHLSPTGQPDVTLVPSQMPIDEGFEDELNFGGRPTGDFMLFDTSSNPAPMAHSSGEFFPELSQYNGQFPGQFDPYTGQSLPHGFDDMLGFENSH
jgi:uncharacterized C2H2 Zn-finger protein